MATYYKLVELLSGNVADDFDTLDEAIIVLADAVATHGVDAMSTYSLLEVDDGSVSLVAMEGELLELVARGGVGSPDRASQILTSASVAD